MIAFNLNLPDGFAGPNPAQVDREVVATLQELGALGQRLVVERTPRGIASGGGGLRGSIFHEMRGTPARRATAISSSAFYAPIVETGRRPGTRPPLAPIMLWVRRKLGVSADQARSVAFLVARKIGREGTEGAHMFERTFRQLEPIARQRFAAMAQRIAQRFGGR